MSEDVSTNSVGSADYTPQERDLLAGGAALRLQELERFWSIAQADSLSVLSASVNRPLNMNDPAGSTFIPYFNKLLYYSDFFERKQNQFFMLDEHKVAYLARLDKIQDEICDKLAEVAKIIRNFQSADCQNFLDAWREKIKIETDSNRRRDDARRLRRYFGYIS